MKISINGEIVDTEKIFKITPVIRGYFNSDDGDVWFVEDNNGNREYCNYRYQFEIEFFERKSIVINDESCEKTTKLRKNILNVWVENQPTIPLFNL